MLGKVLLSIVAMAGSALAQAPAPAAAPALTVDQIISKNIQARGGMDKLKAVKSMRMSGKMTVGPGMEAPAMIEQKRPDSFRLEITLQGLTMVQAYDGKTGWMIMPFQGNKDPQPMSAEDLKDVQDQADFDGPLVDYQAKGHKVELAGKEPVEGADAYKVKVTRKNGTIEYVYIDADSFLEMKSEGKRTVRGTEVESESVMGDYKSVEGLMVPYSIEVGQKGSQQRQKITVEKVELNVPIEDAAFKMPEAPKPAATPPTKPPSR